MLADFTDIPRVAYFSMEIALQSDIPTYSGGLGVLAGDTLRSAADLEVPMVAVTLVHRMGYFRQSLGRDGQQREEPDPWQPESVAERLPARVAVSIGGDEVWVGAWLYVVQAHMGGRQPVVLLDTDLPDNKPEHRSLTHYLYGGDQAYRLKQEAILGLGGSRILQALGFRIIQYHLNEGHAALLGIELLNRNIYPADARRPDDPKYDLLLVRELCNFTTHTPVEAGHDKFPYPLVNAVLGEPVSMDLLRTLAGKDEMNMTRLALNLSEYVNGVARRHAQTSRNMFPGYQVRSITNGIHPMTWAHPAMKKVFNVHLPGWCHQPELLSRADHALTDKEVTTAHRQAKGALLTEIQSLSGDDFDPDVFTIGFARRMTSYKRPELLFTDLERLRTIARQRPVQVVLAGKAHPRDNDGKKAIEDFFRYMDILGSDVDMVFLPNYNLEMAASLVAGVDLWLNTPLPPLEASGTSGMKAAINGVPQLSVLDGWWAEACMEGLNGWSIDTTGSTQGDANSLYQKLESVILPLYYEDQPGWVMVMKEAIKNAAFFNSHRMLRRYATEAYLR